RVAAMGGGDGDEDGRLADLEPADAMEHRHTPYAGPARTDRDTDLAHLGLGHRGVRLVFEELHGTTVRLVPDDTGEDHDTASAGIVDTRRDLMGGQGRVTDGEDFLVVRLAIFDLSPAPLGRRTACGSHYRHSLVGTDRARRPGRGDDRARRSRDQ